MKILTYIIYIKQIYSSSIRCWSINTAAYIHSYTCVCMRVLERLVRMLHTQTHTQTFKLCKHKTCTCNYICLCVYFRKNSSEYYTHTDTHTYIHTYVNIQKYIQAFTQTVTHTHTHTCVLMYVQSQTLIMEFLIVWGFLCVKICQHLFAIQYCNWSSNSLFNFISILSPWQN